MIVRLMTRKRLLPLYFNIYIIFLQKLPLCFLSSDGSDLFGSTQAPAFGAGCDQKI
jgi:hypothetical protein